MSRETTIIDPTDFDEQNDEGTVLDPRVQEPERPMTLHVIYGSHRDARVERYKVRRAQGQRILDVCNDPTKTEYIGSDRSGRAFKLSPNHVVTAFLTND